MFMFSLILFLVLPFLIESYIKVPLKRWNDRITTNCQPMYMPIAMKQSSNGIDDEYYGETRIPDDNLSNQVRGGEEDLLSKETDTFQDYSVFSSESFSALKGLASASLSIILSANTALINATTEAMEASKRGQNLWLVDTETRTLPFGENSTIVRFGIMKVSTHSHILFSELVFVSCSFGTFMCVNLNLQKKGVLPRLWKLFRHSLPLV